MKVVSVFAIAIVAASPMSAQPSPEPDDNDPDGVERALDARLRNLESAARAWHYSWLGIYSAAAATRGTLAFTLSSSDARTAQGVGAVVSSAGIVGLLYDPIAPLSASERVQVINAAYPDTEKRIAAKRNLLIEYRNEEEGRIWLRRLLGWAFNAGAAAFLLFAENNELAAGLQLGVGVAVVETQLFTLPDFSTDVTLVPTASGAAVSFGF